MTPDELKQARKSLGLKQQDMYPLLGYTCQSALSDAETGKTTRPHGAVVLLLRAYQSGALALDWMDGS